MHPIHNLIRLDEMDGEDDRFAVRSFSSPERLELSLDRYGILSPLWVWARENGGYSLVDGFKCVAWAGKRQLEQAPAMVFPSSCPYEELLVLRVEAKLFGPLLNAAEKAQLIAKANDALPQPFLYRHLLPALGIPSRTDVVDRWCKLSTSGEALLQAAASGAIAERVALELVGWGEEERAETLALLMELRCSSSIQAEVAERVTEIALRRNQPRLAVLRQPELRTAWRDSEGNHRQKTQAVRELLGQWRFPRLQERETRLARDLPFLGLPSGIRLLHPPAFEGDAWRLEVAFTEPNELKRQLERVLAVTEFGVLEQMMTPGGE
jgi:ParB family chromosome partitioning protein